MKKKAARNDCIVAFGVGTQSIRAALIDVCGNVVDIVKTPIEPYFSANPGWAEQQPMYYRDRLCETSKRLAQREPFGKAAIKAATITTQRGTYGNVDKGTVEGEKGFARHVSRQVAGIARARRGERDRIRR